MNDGMNIVSCPEITADRCSGERLRRPATALLSRYPQLRQIAELFDHLKDVMAWIKDRQGRFCWVNRAVLMMQTGDRCQTTGDAAAAILG